MQGKEVIQYYIDELINEGVTYIAPFEGSKGRPRAISTVSERRASVDDTGANTSDANESECPDTESNNLPGVQGQLHVHVGGGGRGGDLGKGFGMQLVHNPLIK